MLQWIVGLLLFLALVETNRAYSLPVGVATLALQNRRFPVDQLCRSLKNSKTPYVAFLFHSFGTSIENLKRLDRCTKNLTLQVYVSCGPCKRPGGTLDTWRGGIPQYRQYLRKLRRVKLALSPNIRWVLIPELEDNLSPSLRLSLTQEIRKVLGLKRTSIATNPVRASRTLSYPLEIHDFDERLIASLRPLDIVSADGVQEEPSPRLLSLLSTKRVRYLHWLPCWQGLVSATSPKLPIKDRRFVWCNKDQTDSLLKGIY